MKKYFLFLVICTFFFSLSPAQFSQVGSQLDGNAPNDNFGFSVAMNESGKTIIVGAPLYDSDFGQVRVFQQIAGDWTQIGGDINGNEIGHQFGFSVAISANGKRIALGGIGGSTTTQGGHVRVYDLVNEQWVQRGETILAEAVGDQFGSAIAMNAAGNRIVVGATKNDGNGQDAGHVRVYEFQNNAWTQLGVDLDGAAAGDEYGISVSMSRDGNIIAAGSSRNSSAGSAAGQAQVFQWQNGSWTQMGSDILGQHANEFLGLSLNLAEDGHTLAVGASGHNHGAGIGSVRVYSFDNNLWTQKGMDIRGSLTTEAFGQTVSINGDGTILGIGTPSSDEAGTSSGRFNLFSYDSTVWAEVYQPITGKASFDFVGKSLALNREGNRFVIGANLANGTQGYTVVYEDSLMPVSIQHQLIPGFLQILPKRDHISIQLELPNQSHPVSLSLSSLSAQAIYSETLPYRSSYTIPASLASGVYLLRIKQNHRMLIRKLIVRTNE
ncbi:MAG: hypothetical protein AAF587_03830 [Bacteroidota bacterium]